MFNQLRCGAGPGAFA